MTILHNQPIPTPQDLARHHAYQAGLKDGSRSRMTGAWGTDPDYLRGWREGFKSYRSSIPEGIQEGYLERSDRDELMNPL